MKEQDAKLLAEHINTVDRANIQAVAEPIKARSKHWWVRAVRRCYLTMTASTPEQWEEIRYMWMMLAEDDKAA